MAVTEKSMFPPDDTEGRKFWYDEKEQMWVSVIFPSMKPSGRHDVALLDDWTLPLVQCGERRRRH